MESGVISNPEGRPPQELRTSEGASGREPRAAGAPAQPERADGLMAGLEPEWPWPVATYWWMLAGEGD